VSIKEFVRFRDDMDCNHHATGTSSRVGVAVCCSMLQRVAVCCRVLPCVAVCCRVLSCVAVCCSALQRVFVCILVSNINNLIIIDRAEFPKICDFTEFSRES